MSSRNAPDGTHPDGTHPDDALSAAAAEIARLKRAFGARLGPAEEMLLAREPAGGEPSPEWLRDCLAAWKPAPDPEGERRAGGPPDLVARFESTRVARARDFQRSFPRFLAFVLGISALPCFAIVYFKTGSLPLRPLLEILAFMWACMGAFCCACWWRARRILREDDLVRFTSARESGPRGRPLSRALGGVALLGLLALQAQRHGWLRSAAVMAALLAVMVFAERVLRRQEKRSRLSEDQELWSWWYGRKE